MKTKLTVKSMRPGARSALGSSLEPGAFAKPATELGQLTPPNFDSFPSGQADVTFQSGASTPDRAGRASEQVMITGYKP